MGTPEFGVPSLRLMVEKGYKPILCITQPDRPKGRKKRLQPPAIKVEAERLGIDVAQPENLNNPDFLDRLRELNPDIIVTVAYGGYLKKNIRKLPKFGCINLHPSLLPKYRGSAPINFALFNGDKTSGVTIFKIVAEMDAGPILLRSQIDILDSDNYSSMSKKLSYLGADKVCEVLKLYENETVEFIKQDHDKASFSNKIFKDDMLIKWDSSAKQIYNLSRGLADVPGATAAFRQTRIKLIELELTDNKSTSDPGTIIEIIKNLGLVVATKDYNILIKKLQPAGKKIMTSHAYNLGARIEISEKFKNGF